MITETPALQKQVQPEGRFITLIKKEFIKHAKEINRLGKAVASLAVDAYNSLQFDSVPTQDSNNLLSSGSVYTALNSKSDKSDTYTKTEVDTLVQNAGGSSVTVDSAITQGGTNPVQGGAIYTALNDKADKSDTYTKTEVDTALGNKQGTLTFDTTPTDNSTNPVTSGGVYTSLASKGDVTTDTDQNITGVKTFVGTKKVLFKQSGSNDKLGFTLYTNSNVEKGYLEFNPTNKIDNAPLLTLGNYATNANGITQVGFRRYSSVSGANGAYNLLMPLIADAKSPFSLTTTYTNFYLPLGFTDGTTTVRTAKSGLVDISPLLASLEARISALEGN